MSGTYYSLYAEEAMNNNVSIYNTLTSRRITQLGKHSTGNYNSHTPRCTWHGRFTYDTRYYGIWYWQICDGKLVRLRQLYKGKGEWISWWWLYVYVWRIFSIHIMLHNDKGTLNRVNDKVDKMRNESCLFVSWYKYEGNLNIGIILLHNFCS